MGDIADMLFEQGFDELIDMDDRHEPIPISQRYRYHNLKPGASCPECGNMLELRTNKKNGSQFVGCSGFPSCRVLSGYHRLEAEGEFHVDKVISVNAYVKPRFNCRDCRFHKMYEDDGLGFFASV